MRKVNFMSGINAKLVLAAMALGSFVLTGCEKENFDVNVPDIDITIPEAEPGVVYVNLSATSNNGNALNDVKFTDENGAAVDASKAYYDRTDLKIFASKDGYTTVVKTVNVPQPIKGSFVVIPVNFVMTAVEEKVESETTDVDFTKEEPAEVKAAPFSIDKTFAIGTHTVDVPVPNGAYLTAEQKKALMDYINALEGPETRASLSDEELANLETAKGMLREAVNKIPADIADVPMKNVPVTFELDQAAKGIEFTITTSWFNQKIELVAKVAGQNYVAKGEQTLAGPSKIGAKGFSITHAHGVEIEHDHGHGTGNAGGGEGGK